MKPSAPLSLRLVGLTTLLSVGSAGAETTETAPELYLELPPYEVTGTLIRGSESMLALPLTEIDDAELNLWSDLNPVEALRDEPFIYGNSNTENDSNSGSGSAGANLRGLGNLSTLTLINGRRAGGNSAFGFQHGGFADLNLIPSAALREIEVVTDGTSVAYGSDAVAGTVNLRLHDLYTGNRIDADYSNTTDGDASEKSLSFLSGHLLGADTNLVLLGSWYQRNAIYARDRAISDDADRRDQGGVNQGSPTYPGRIRVDGVEYRLNEGVAAPSDFSDYQVFDPVEDLFNFSEYAPAVPAYERASFMANLLHPLGEQVAIRTEWLYTRSEFSNGLAPAPWVTSAGAFENPAVFDAIVNGPSPHIPNGIDPSDLQQLRYRSVSLGNIDNRQDKEALRGLIALEGEIGDWRWEAGALLIETHLESHWSGITDARIIEDAIETGSFNPFAASDATGIIPSGPLAGQVYDNAAALAAAEADAVNDFEESLWNYDLLINGPLTELETGPIEIAAGLGYRNEQIDVEIDELFENANNLGGSARESFSGEREVQSIFAEALVPVYADGPLELDFTASARYEHYEDSSGDGGIDPNRYDAFVHRIGLLLRAQESLRFRIAYGTSFRAPTLTESYGGDTVASPIYNDPLGFTPDSSRVTTLIQSNPELDPETSRNLNIGAVFEPDPERGWRADVSYYHIRTDDAIVNGAQYLVNQSAAGRPLPAGSFVLRDPGTNELSLVFAQWFNAAEIMTDGIEYDLRYRFPTARGGWEASVGLNQVLSYEITAAPGESAESYLGDFVDPRAAGGNIVGRGSIPEYKGYARLVWRHDQLTLGATLNYVHSLDDNAAFTTDGNSRTVDSWTTLDLVARYEWTNRDDGWLAGTSVQFGIDNVTDEPPPFAAGAFADGYDSSLYELDGRRLHLAISRSF